MGNTKKEGLILFFMFLFFGALLLTGTFYDKAIAEAIYMPKDVLVTLITTVGIYPFFASANLFMGMLVQRTAHSDKNIAARSILCVLFVLIALFVGFIGSASIVDVDCLGGIFPKLNRNIPVIVVLAPFAEYSWFFVGYRLASKSADAALFKRVLTVAVIFILTYISMKGIKLIFSRPRYRSVAEGYKGVDYVPWYRISKNPSGLMKKYDLARGEFNSFPSGHGVFSISVISGLIALSWVVPELKGKRIPLIIFGFIFSSVILFTRMLLGAHYLSDVSAGAIIGLVFVTINLLIQNRIEKKVS